MKKKMQFLGIILNHDGDFGLKRIETLFLQQRYQDLSEPIKMKGNDLTPCTMQLFMLQSEDKTWNIVKHVRFAEGTKIFSSTIVNTCASGPVEIAYQRTSETAPEPYSTC